MPEPSPLKSPGRLDSFGVFGELSVGSARHRVARIDGLVTPGMPYSIRVLLENLLRHEDGERVTREQIEAVLAWGTGGPSGATVDVHPSRVFLHDTNGVPAFADLAAMRDAMHAIGGDPAVVNPRIPAELVVDHSVIADVFGSPDAYERNAALEYERNAERYRFLRWAKSSLRNVHIVPPGKGIMHQVNLEHLARVVVADAGWAYPDLCVGTDSHTTMINGIGVLGWGVGGIEAEAAMLGESLNMPVPPVVGVRLTGALPRTATATDLVLTITEVLRARGVVGKFVEFHGEGVRALSLPDRATIANMSPEFGSTCAYFPVDEETIRYLRFTGRTPEHVALVEAYAKAQRLWHWPDDVADYTETVELDLGAVEPSVAGPHRPQDRVPLSKVGQRFRAEAGDNSPPVPEQPVREHSVPEPAGGLRHGVVGIAAITSCTNTSNPTAMVTAALLARNAARRGLRSRPWVKTTLSPGSRVVTAYLEAAGLTPYLEQLGFHLAGYGCMTCIGASGPLVPQVQEAARDGLTVAAVLSGNRNFAGRINPDVRQNYLASPPLVVAYALAGTVDTDLTSEPLGHAPDGSPVRLADVWPSPEEVARVVETVITPRMFAEAYEDVLVGDVRWENLEQQRADRFRWDPGSDYLRRPTFFDGMSPEPWPVADIEGARVLVMLGDTTTTDHISPAGAIPADSPAGRYLSGRGVARRDFNTYASRRGNHEVMVRGTFANVRLRNQLAPGVEGGYTASFAEGGRLRTVYDAAMAYRAAGTPLVVLGGALYGSGSSRDWAAKGPALLGVRAVLAESFERIHRSNLIGMGVLPLQYRPGESALSLGLSGREVFDIRGLDDFNGSATTVTVSADGRKFDAIVRLDTPREREIYRHGGIMRLVLRTLMP
ncbi:aconitate hydratase AcnA [Nonomuraea maritima]|uniref:aconitate hydratase AcnA n=1 Tax=Nonomuraea maritima TaxID=683260 RepID=UPI00371ECF5B